MRFASAKAKLFATEAAQRPIDTAVQVHGAVGLQRGSITERLYRAVRAMRIYEGASEVMKVVMLGPCERAKIVRAGIVSDLSAVPEAFLDRVRANVRDHIASTEPPSSAR